MVSPITDEFGYNARAGRYVYLNTGRFVAEEYVLGVMEARIAEAFTRLDAMLRGALASGASLDAWQEAFVVELRRAHTQLAALGRGGWEQMTFSDWGRVGQQLRFEYEHLREFARQIANGELSMAQIQMRMQMYADHVWTSYWAARTAAMEEAGATEEQRIVDAAAENCDDCIGYAAQGWQPIGTLPEPGQDSQCQANCRCMKEYR